MAEPTPRPTEAAAKAARELEKKREAERKEFLAKRKEEAFVADLRDDTLSLILGDAPSSEHHAIFAAIEAKGGPTARTLEAWLKKEVKRPQTPTLRAALQLVGKDLGITDGRYKPLGER